MIMESSPPPSPKPYTSSLEPAIPVPTHGPGGSFTILAKTFIPNTTPAQVLSVIRDTSTWREWNSMTPIYTIKASPDASDPPASIDVDIIPTGKDGWLERGTAGTMDVFMNGDGLVEGAKRSRQQDMEITFLERIDEEGRKGFRVAWKATGYAHWQLHSERVTDLVEAEEGGVKGTSYVCWETFGGILGAVVKRVVGGQLVQRFGEYAGGLRAFCVERYGDGGAERERNDGAAEGIE